MFTRLEAGFNMTWLPAYAVFAQNRFLNWIDIGQA